MAMAALEPLGQSQPASVALEPTGQALQALEPQSQIEHGRALLELLGHSRPACSRTNADASLDEEPRADERAPPRGGAAAREPCHRQVAAMSTSLQELSDEDDPACLVVVEHLHKLGFRAEQKLKSHFSRYGAVSRVMVVQRQQETLKAAAAGA
ncbi:unnamed protein product [Prorocentrum cordatum]|uniref:Uncharacterized protein n=1 Tax=Prorocentrum cordatum TaxID=2364126 RepID=A0ABN9WM27_9DINO|nr:unnamed protein product [Polarella glacialis]